VKFRGCIAIAALLAHGAAQADSDAMAAAALPILVAVGTVFYVGMCLVSIPFSLFLRGSIFKRIDDDDTSFVFTVIAAVPVAGLLLWGMVSRERAAAFERSRVQYAEYLEGEKSLAKLAKENSEREPS
jgi:hypothetical protein